MVSPWGVMPPNLDNCLHVNTGSVKLFIRHRFSFSLNLALTGLRVLCRSGETIFQQNYSEYDHFFFFLGEKESDIKQK